MGIFDEVKKAAKKAEQLVAEHPDQVKKALDKAEQSLDKASGGKFHDKIEAAADKAEAVVEKRRRH